MKKEDEEKKKRIEQISKHLHPHDDEPDPTAHMGNYNFPQMLFAFCVGFCTMFVLAVDEINDFKGCPFPEYFDEPRSTVPYIYMGGWGPTHKVNFITDWDYPA